MPAQGVDNPPLNLPTILLFSCNLLANPVKDITQLAKSISVSRRSGIIIIIIIINWLIMLCWWLPAVGKTTFERVQPFSTVFSFVISRSIIKQSVHLLEIRMGEME